MPKIDGALLDPSDTDTGRMESRPPDQLPTAAISLDPWMGDFEWSSARFGAVSRAVDVAAHV